MATGRPYNPLTKFNPLPACQAFGEFFIHLSLQDCKHKTPVDAGVLAIQLFPPTREWGEETWESHRESRRTPRDGCTTGTLPAADGDAPPYSEEWADPPPPSETEVAGTPSRGKDASQSRGESGGEFEP